MKMKIKFRTIILIITIYYLLLWPLSSEALKTSVTNFGKKFYLGYMQAATTNQHGSHFPFVVITTLNQAAQVTITNNYDKSISLFSISAQSYREIPLPISLENSVNGVSSKTVLVTSDQDIIVEGYHVHPLSADGYLALPTTAFGKQYVIATYTPYQRSQFLVTASQDQTQLSIIFPRKVNYLGTIYSRNNHLIVNLQKSQSFYFGYNQDITGTIINSNKKVAVQSGNRCALVPVRIIDCEYLVEQLLPTNSLGKNYVLTTFADRTAGDIFRVVAAYDNTSIRMHLNGQIHIISQGSFLEFHLASDTGTYLTCSKPCAVAQYSKGQNADHSISDPMMILVPSISQYQSSYVFYSVDTDGDEIIDRFVNIAILDSQKNGLRLDGSALQHVRWVTVQTSNGTYAVAHVFIHGGRHVLNHNSSSVQFSLIQYGYGPIGLSFGFLAGIKLSLELDDYLYINQHPSSKNVSEGQTVILRCRASSNYQQINVIWLKGSTHISNYTTTNSNGESQLTLPKVAEKDIGWYRCRFSNPAGLNETESAYVDVFEIPRIVINPQNVQVNQGSSTNFHCKGEGLPAPTCIWLKNQVTINSTRYLILSSSEIKLQLNNVVIGDAGNYVCFCSNGIGNATSSIATLTVLSLPIIITNPSNMTALIGQSIKLLCNGTGNPIPTIAWIKNGQVVNNYTVINAVVGSYRSSELTIQNIKSYDMGRYWCSFSNSAGTKVSLAATITIYLKPTVITPLTSYTAIQGTAINISCQANGYPIPSIKWFKDGNLINTIHQSSISGGSNLYLTNLTPQDAGNYTCYSENIAGNTSSLVGILIIYTKPAIIISPVNTTVIQGNTLMLSCQASGKPLPTIQWIKDGYLVNSSLYSSSTSGLSQLQIPLIKITDVGNYVCFSSNSFGNASSMAAFITVYYSPVIKLNPSNTGATEGHSITLLCSGTGNPLPQVSWLKSGQPVEKGDFSSSYTAFSISSNITIQNANLNDTGLYQCNFSNSIGSTQSSNAIVTLYTKPVITRSPKSLMITEGSSINLTCQATSNPAPAFVWQKNKQTLDSKMFSSSVNTSILMLSSVTKEITGNYSCIATNFVGNTTSNDAVVIIHYKTAINNNPTDIAAIEGQNITLYCSGISDPISNVTWFKNNNFVGNNHNYTIVSSVDNLIASSLLIIYGVQLADNGAYQCKFTNPIGSSLSRNATLKIYEKPIAIISSGTRFAVTGKVLTLSCRSINYPPPNFFWFKNGQKINNSVTSSPSPNLSLLTISSVTMNDEGNYTCLSTTIAGNVTSSPVKIIVLVFPVIVVQPLSTGVIEGMSIILYCNATSKPIATISWLKNGFSLNVNHNITSFISNGYIRSRLTIYNSTAKDYGSYQCNCTNTIGSAISSMANITIYSSPVIVNTSKSITAMRGTSTEMLCQATGNPQPKFSWLKDGANIAESQFYSPSVDQSVLRLINLTLNGEGNYTCVSSNLAGNTTKTIKITVLAETIVTQQPKDIAIIEGNPIKLSCNATSKPISTIIWLKNGNPLSQNYSITALNSKLLSSSILTISAATRNDQGIYQCNFTNIIATVLSKAANITIYTYPIIVSTPQNITLSQGASLTFNCQATGNPLPTFIWLKGDKIVPESKYDGSTPGLSILNLNNVTRSNAGKYVCISSNLAGNTSITNILTVYAPPTIVETPQSIAVIEGSAIIIQCNGSGNPNPSIIWLKNGIIISNYSISSIISYGYTTSSLVIQNSQKSDGGLYQCRLSNLLGSLRSQNASIVIYTRPKILVSPKSQNVSQGSYVTLSCIASGYPLPAINWMKNGHMMSSRRNSDILTFNAVALKDKGIYQCSAGNLAGNSTSSSAALYIYTLPIIEDISKSVAIPIGNSVTLKCTGSSIPSPTVEWFKDSSGTLQKMTTFSRHQTLNNSVMSILSINATKSGDAGSYVCRVKNQFTPPTSQSIIITILEPPSSVVNVQVFNITSSGFKITWQAPNFTGYTSITNYTIETTNYPPANAINRCQFSLTDNECIVNSNRNVVTFFDLIPYSSYNVTIWGQNIAGKGKDITVTLRTDQAAPGNSVTNLIALAYNATAIKIEWSLPTLPYGMVAYKLYQWISQSSSGISSSAGGNTTIYNGVGTTVYSSNLNENQQYFYQVIPYNIKYGLIGPASTIATATTHEDVPKSSPINITVNAVTSKIIKVSWKPPKLQDRNGVIITYAITYYAINVNNATTIQVDGLTRSIDIDELKPYTIYHVKIKAATTAGFGPDSSIANVITNQAAPSVGPNIQTVSIVNGSSLRIKSNIISNENINGILQGFYVVLLNNNFQSTRSITVLINQTDTQNQTRILMINNLQFYSQYRISLRAFTIAGPGPNGSEVSFTTPQSVPSAPPQNVQAKGDQLPASRATVVWNPPPLNQQNGDIIAYKIRYGLSSNSSNNIDNNIQVIIIKGQMQAHLINLQPLTDYSIEVAASTMMGYGPFGRPVIYRTHSAESPDVFESPKDQFIPAGSNLTLYCSGKGDPIPQIQWIKNGLPINPAYRVVTNGSKSELIISRISSIDAGSYQCRLTNVKSSVTTKPAVVTVTGTDNLNGYCPTVISNDIRWQKIQVGNTATAPCPVPARGIASKACTKSAVTGLPIWKPTDTIQCISPSFNALSNMLVSLDTTNKSAAETVINSLQNAISRRKNELYAGELATAMSTLSKLKSFTSISLQLLTDVINITGNLLNLQNKNGWKDVIQNKNGEFTLMDTLENIAGKAEVPSSKSRITITNTELDLEIARLSGSLATLDYQYPKSSSGAGSKSSNPVTLKLSALSLRRYRFTKGIVLSFKTLADILPSTYAVRGSNASRNAIGINSMVLSASFYPKSSQNLIAPLQLIFANTQPILNQNNTIQRMCTFWGSSSSGWGWLSSGCWVGSNSSANSTVCYCNHTTTFTTLIRSVPTTLPVNDLKLEIITYIGCGFVVLSLLLILIPYLIYWRSLQSLFTLISVNFVVNIILSNLMVVTGITHVQSQAVCAGVAVVLHFTVLAAFMLQLQQSIHVYRKLVNSSVSKVSNVFCMATAYLIPAAIVTTTAAYVIKQYGLNNYLSKNVCWPTADPPVVLAFAIPALIMALINIWLLVASLRILRNNQKITHSLYDDQLLTISNTVTANLFLLPLLTFGWAFFTTMIIFNQIALQYLFAIFSILQGLASIFFLVIKNDKIYQAYKFSQHRKNDRDSTVQLTASTGLRHKLRWSRRSFRDENDPNPNRSFVETTEIEHNIYLQDGQDLPLNVLPTKSEVIKESIS